MREKFGACQAIPPSIGHVRTSRQIDQVELGLFLLLDEASDELKQNEKA